MTRWRALLLGGIIALSCQRGHAQSFVETALLFSRTQPGGSARIQSLGGTQVSLGGDFSSSLSNPAGLGMYNRSELTLTPAINFAKTSSQYLGETTNDNKGTFHIPGFSMAFHNDYDKLTGFLGGTFSIGYTRINDFNRDIKYQGFNEANSIIDYFVEDATGAPITQFGSNGSLRNTPTHLAFENYLIGDSTVINPSFNPNAYFTDVEGKPFQLEEIQTRGAQTQWSFAYGANYNDKLFIGAGIGITTLRYKSNKLYTEAFQEGPLFDMSLEETLEIRGSGVNITGGVTFRPKDFIQVAISATSPTYYELSDTYNALMRTRWNNFDYFGDRSLILGNEQFGSDVVTSDYSLSTPGKVTAGATFFLEKKGFFSLDVERVNYGKAKYDAITQGLSFDVENQDIRSLYQSVFNLRSGVEYRLNAVKFRAGYAYLPQPFKAIQNGVSANLQRLSGGIGYREKTFYIDLAVIYSFSDNTYRPYTVNSVNTPLVEYKPRSTNVMFTIGLPF